jgi:hypothetical protein
MCPLDSPGPPPLKKGGGEEIAASLAVPVPFRVRGLGACGTLNLSSDDALDVLQISCRSRARSREGYSCGWAEAHPHPGPYRADTSCGSHRWRDFFSLSALQGRGNRIWRDCCLSLLCHSRFRGNDANREAENPNAIALPIKGAGRGGGETSDPSISVSRRGRRRGFR